MAKFFIGCVAGVLSVLVGLGAAKADCSQDFGDASQVRADAQEACEQAAVADVASCVAWEVNHAASCVQDFSDAVSLAEERCDYWVQGMLEDGYSEEQLGGASGMWEACIRLETPVGPLPAAQHYDTTDGTFWQVAGSL